MIDERPPADRSAFGLLQSSTRPMSPVAQMTREQFVQAMIRQLDAQPGRVPYLSKLDDR